MNERGARAVKIDGLKGFPLETVELTVESIESQTDT